MNLELYWKCSKCLRQDKCLNFEKSTNFIQTSWVGLDWLQFYDSKISLFQGQLVGCLWYSFMIFYYLWTTVIVCPLWAFSSHSQLYIVMNICPEENWGFGFLNWRKTISLKSKITLFTQINVTIEHKCGSRCT